MRTLYKCAFKSTMPDGRGIITLVPVYSGSVENDAFFTDMLHGYISLGVVKPDIASQFEVDQNYYIDFTSVV